MGLSVLLVLGVSGGVTVLVVIVGVGDLSLFEVFVWVVVLSVVLF